MLHAAYDRLSKSERTKINAQLQKFNDTGTFDDRIRTIMDSYRKHEPNDVVNEMHSIFATEVQNLTPELERYYGQYFHDRSKIIKYATAYQTEFTSRQNRVDEFDIQLRQIKQEIDNNSGLIENQELEIADLRAQLERDRDSDNIAGYNQNVPVYNARIDKYNALIQQTKLLIESYNRKVAERNDIALQVTDLARSIDSTFQPLEQQ